MKPTAIKEDRIRLLMGRVWWVQNMNRSHVRKNIICLKIMSEVDNIRSNNR